MSVVTGRLWAAAAEAAGHPHGTELSYTADSFDGLLARVVSDHGTSFARVVPICSVLADGLVASTAPTTAALSEGAAVDLLPPFTDG